MKLILFCGLIFASMFGSIASMDYIGDLNATLNHYLTEQGINPGQNDSVFFESVVCEYPVIMENGSIYQNCQGGAICSVCHRRVGEYVVHEGKPYCFDDFKGLKR